jgi:hypothetical protein
VQQAAFLVLQGLAPFDRFMISLAWINIRGGQLPLAAGPGMLWADPVQWLPQAQSRRT